MMPEFDCFVGIDWSGDGARRQNGLKIALATPGDLAPELKQCPDDRRGRWSRHDAKKWIAEFIKHSRALIGLDFAFGFPEVRDICGRLRLDWGYVEGICRSDGEFNYYGRPFFENPSSRHACLTNSRWFQGSNYEAGRLRVTDRAAASVVGATPQTIFNAVGPAQVGPSSISGMRMLLELQAEVGDRLAIWPFDDPGDQKSVLVEIFPRYFALSRIGSAKLANHNVLNAALRAFGSAEVRQAPTSEDEGDALLSAAALRSLSSQQSLFLLPDSSIRSQGWIFGVPVPNGKSS
jgi:hypothetical protein